MSDDLDDGAADREPNAPLPHRPQAIGRLYNYRVTYTDGTIEHYEGHAVSQPTAGFVRIHRRHDDGAWQMVFGARVELIRSVRALVNADLDRLAKADIQLRTALDHLGRVFAVAPETCKYGDDWECTKHPQAGLTDEGECGVASARKFLNELRPF